MAPTETVKVKKSVAEMVRWMNTEGGLVAELRLAAIAKPLAALDESTALEVLNAVLEQEEPVDDPTVWVCEAAKALAEEEAGDGVYDEPAPAPKPASGGRVKLPASTVERVKALNAEGTLQAPLPLEDVAAPLSLLSKEAQEQILTALEERAASIASPVNWVINGCYKKAGKGKSKGKGKGQSMAKGKSKGDSGAPSKGKGKGKGATKALTASEQKILRTVNFVNGSFELERPLKFFEIKESLDLVDEKTQLRILQRLKDKLSEGTEVANPGTYIKRACERAYERYEEMVQEKKKRKAAEASGETAPVRKKQAKVAKEAEAGEEEWDQEAWDEAWEEE